MKNYKLRATIGAGLLALGLAGGGYVYNVFEPHYEAVCTPALIEAKDIKDRQYWRLRASSNCTDLIEDRQDLVSTSHEVRECLDQVFNDVTELDNLYQDHLRENNLSEEQVRGCQDLPNKPYYIVGTFVEAGLFFSVLGGLWSLVTAYRRRKEMD